MNDDNGLIAWRNSVPHHQDCEHTEGWDPEEDKKRSQYWYDRGKGFTRALDRAVILATRCQRLRGRGSNRTTVEEADLTEAYILGRVMAWYRPGRNGKKRYRGRYLLLNSNQIAEDAALPPLKVQRAFSRLQKRELLIRWKVSQSGMAVRLNWPVLDPLLEAAHEVIRVEEEEDVPTPPKGVGCEDDSDFRRGNTERFRVT